MIRPAIQALQCGFERVEIRVLAENGNQLLAQHEGYIAKARRSIAAQSKELRPHVHECSIVRDAAALRTCIDAETLPQAYDVLGSWRVDLQPDNVLVALSPRQ